MMYFQLKILFRSILSIKYSKRSNFGESWIIIFVINIKDFKILFCIRQLYFQDYLFRDKS